MAGISSGPLDDMPYREVRDALRAAFAAEPVMATAHHYDTPMYAAAKQLPATGGGWPGDRFRNRVRRALTDLVDLGELVKFGRGDTDPEGRTVMYPVYYTPDALEAKRRKVAVARQELDRVEAAWTTVHAALTAAGFPPGTMPGKPPRLSLGQWQQLVTRIRESGEDHG